MVRPGAWERLGNLNWSVRGEHGLRQRQAVLPNHQLPPAWIDHIGEIEERQTSSFRNVARHLEYLPTAFLIAILHPRHRRDQPQLSISNTTTTRQAKLPNRQVAERCPFPRVESVVGVTTPPKLPEARESLRRRLITEYTVAQDEVGCQGMLHTFPDG